jgi:CTP:molybdopterin cytidylyltransferase MocA
MTVNESEIIERAEALPDRYAGRVRSNDLYAMRAMASGGEWQELIDVLVGSLTSTRAAVTASERDELCSLLAAMDMPQDLLGGLNVDG